MIRNRIRVSTLLLFVGLGVSILSGQSITAAGKAAVPALTSFSGRLNDIDGKPLTSLTGVTFSLYSDPEGGTPLWMEVQNVQPDRTGHYTVTLGATKSAGLPSELFTSAEARWLGVQPQGQAVQPRVLLLSVPYALKAADAETIGGLPPSAFMLTPAPGAATQTPSVTGSESSGGLSPALGGTGTTNFLPLWTNSTTLGSSVLFQSGSGTTAKIGLNTNTPTSTLDVKGSTTLRGNLSLTTTGTATPTVGKNSQPLTFSTSVFNSGTSTAVNQNFRWLAEPVGNNTTTATGSLNLLFAQGSATQAETGLKIASNGQITFAAGQTFPGTGTVSGVTAGTDLTGGGSSGIVTLNLDTTKVPQLSANNNFTGNQNFAGNLTATGTIAAGVVNASTSLNLAGTPFAFGSFANGNVFLGFSGNFAVTGLGNTATGYIALFSNSSGYSNTGIGSAALTSNTTGGANTAVGWTALRGNTTGVDNTASGSQALYYSSTASYNTATGAISLLADTTGSQNTADGAYALESNTTAGENTASGAFAMQLNTTGGENTASGVAALYNNTTGFLNTAIGIDALLNNTTGSGNSAFGAGAGGTTNGAATTGSNNTFVGSFTNPGTQTTLTNATAIGANAQVTVNNALVLGSISGVNGASASTMVGIGTTAPTQTLEVDGGNALVRGPATFQKSGDKATFYLGDTNNFVQALFGVGLNFGVFENPSALIIANGGAVGIGATPDNLLTVNGTADKPGGGSWGTFSDARLKTLHGDFNPGLSQILKLHPIRYRYNEDNAMGIRDRDEHIGFVAQDVQRIIPEAVTENNRGYLLVNNDPILWTMLNAIKEQQREIAALRAQLRAHPLSAAQPAAKPTSGKNKDQDLHTLRSQLNQLRNKNMRLEARLARLERALDDISAPVKEAVVASSTTSADQK